MYYSIHRLICEGKSEIMLFQSTQFIIFLLIVFLLYWNLPHKSRWLLLLLAGYFYYAHFGISYLFLLFGMTAFSYCIGRILSLEKLNHFPVRRKIILILAIWGELSVLFFFKIPKESIILPVGISFYTFQTLGYMIDVYRNQCTAETHFGYFSTSIAFFPILLSGPIERIPGFVTQLKKEKSFIEKDGLDGIKLMFLGYFKKMIIADSLAVYVNHVYGNLSAYTGLPLLLSIILYSIEIYCDFSGYSDIAIGVARLLGLRLTENFKLPYLATSIKDFWRRWHISLTSWFRDYVYIPLGGNRTSRIKKYRNIMITFLLSGLWHGSGLTFLIWGGLHGTLQIIESVCSSKVQLPAPLKRILMFLSVSIAWVFFRAESLSDAFYVLCHSGDGIRGITPYLMNGYTALNMPILQFILLLLFLILLFGYEYFSEKGITVPNFINNKCVKLFTFIVLIEIIIFYYFKYGTDSSTFIYFQF